MLPGGEVGAGADEQHQDDGHQGGGGEDAEDDVQRHVPVPEDAYEAFPLWFVMLYLGIPIAAMLMTPGVIVRALAR